VVCLAPRVPGESVARGALYTWSSGPSTSPLGGSGVASMVS
jgi:hypothetical protein